jgi:hypothetical protein
LITIIIGDRISAEREIVFVILFRNFSGRGEYDIPVEREIVILIFFRSFSGRGKFGFTV